MFTRRMEKIKKFFALYTSGLTRREVELLLKKDTVDALTYLRGKTAGETDGGKALTVKSLLKVTREVFVSFIMQLTPARRLVYGIGVSGFILGLLQTDAFYLIGAFVLFNLLLALELVEKLTTRDELEIAREIQVSLQPVHIPEFRMLSFAAFSKPAKVVGGDFFDIVQPCENRVISIVGDVSDKGISAALYAAYVQSMFESLSGVQSSPTEIFRTLNALISKRLRNGDFITAAIALFDMDEKSVTISRAGHNWPLHYRSETGIITELKPKGLSIGIAEDTFFSDKLEEQKIYLNSGDLLLLYTDGITEATDPQQRMFDLSNLKTAVKETAQESSTAIIDHINGRLSHFVQSNELQDDATMVAVKVK